MFHLLSKFRFLVFVGSALLLQAQAHLTPFTGTWKMDVAASRFEPGPAFQRFTLTFGPDGIRHLDLVHADGRNLVADLPWSDGQEVRVKANLGLDHMSAISRIQGSTFTDSWREEGVLIEDVCGLLSADGQVLSISVKGHDKQGNHPYRNELIFRKQ